MLDNLGDHKNYVTELQRNTYMYPNFVTQHIEEKHQNTHLFYYPHNINCYWSIISMDIFMTNDDGK